MIQIGIEQIICLKCGGMMEIRQGVAFPIHLRGGAGTCHAGAQSRPKPPEPLWRRALENLRPGSLSKGTRPVSSVNLKRAK